jgi:hypothetical protein
LRNPKTKKRKRRRKVMNHLILKMNLKKRKERKEKGTIMKKSRKTLKML